MNPKETLGRRQFLKAALITTAGIATATLVGCGEKESKTLPGMEKFVSSDNPFEIQVPNTWQRAPQTFKSENKNIDFFIAPTFDNLGVFFTIKVSPIKPWIKLEDFTNEETNNLNPSSIEKLSSAKDKDIPESMKRFKAIKVDGRTSLAAYWRRQDRGSQISALQVSFITDAESKDDIRKGWTMTISYPGSMELPVNTPKLNSLYDDFYNSLATFKLLH